MAVPRRLCSHVLAARYEFVILYVLGNMHLAAADKQSCNKEQFLAHLDKGMSSCHTCYFPANGSMNPSEYGTIDFSNKWIYFAGDSTLRQVWGQFKAVLEEAQVQNPPGKAPFLHMRPCLHEALSRELSAGCGRRG